MSGDLFMMRLWKYVDAKKLDNKSKANIFLIMNIILWSGIAFLLSLIAGVFCGYSAEWVEWTVTLQAMQSGSDSLAELFIICVRHKDIFQNTQECPVRFAIQNQY